MKTMKPVAVMLLLALIAMPVIQATSSGSSGGSSNSGSSNSGSHNSGSSNSGSNNGSGSSGSSNSGSGSNYGNGDSGYGSGSGSNDNDNGKSSPPPPKSSSPPPPKSSSPPPPSSNPSPPPPRNSSPPPHRGGGSNPSPPPPSPGKPDCKKNGGVCGDPKIVGGDGVMFYFHGYKDKDFCLVSDSDLHINAHFIGKRPEGRLRDFTWVQALGFVHGPHSLTIAAKHVGKWNGSIDQLELFYNGLAFDLGSTAWVSPKGDMELNRIGATNAVELVIKEKMAVSLTVVPISKEENRVHKYGMTDDDCYAHFDMQFRFFNLSSAVNGVLGQTYQPHFMNPVKRGVAMPIMGGADRFISSSLLSTDCKSSQYTATAIPLGSAMPSFVTVCGSSGLPGGIPGGIACRR